MSAIAPRNAFTGARVVRVPSGNSSSCPPPRSSATAWRTMPIGQSLRMYPASRAPGPKTKLSASGAFSTHAACGRRESSRTASSSEG